MRVGMSQQRNIRTEHRVDVQERHDQAPATIRRCVLHSGGKVYRVCRLSRYTAVRSSMPIELLCT